MFLKHQWVALQGLDPPPTGLQARGKLGGREAQSPPRNGGGEARAEGTLLGYVRSKEGALALLSMVLLIFQGTALSLTLRFSRCACLARTAPGATPLAVVT
jgi:hypothetical protein